MNLNPAEWSRAQDLLLQLVRVLFPLTDRSDSKALFPIQKYFFAPSQTDPSFRFHHAIHLLSTLKSAQIQVNELIEKIPESPSSSKQALPKSSPTGQMTVTLHAKKVVDQVRLAIQTLATSDHLSEPKADPVRVALQRLKPLIDGLIGAISHEVVPFAEEKSASPFRLPLPKSPRDELLRKLLGVPNAEPKEEPAK